MKKLVFKLFVLAAVFIIITDSCESTHQVMGKSKSIMSKSGSQLWVETCTRCHSAPPSVDFDDHEWDLIGMHMQIKAQLTSTEVDKITDYLKETN